MSEKIDSSAVRVNEEQCRALGRCFGRLSVRPDPYLKHPASAEECRHEANYWLFVTAICQSTRTFEGTIGGQWARGWDYLVRASRRRMDDFSAERMRTYTADDLRRLLSDDFDPQHSHIDRVGERLRQLHDCAEKLLQDYAGQAMELYHRSTGYLAGPDGLLNRLAAFEAYGDPMHKKSVLLAGMLHQVAIWPLHDAQKLKVAMDYHAMRVALRSGMIEIVDTRLRRGLRDRSPVQDSTNQLVRSAVSAACDTVVHAAGLSVYAFDKLIWHLGRSCCFYEHDPMCGSARGLVVCFKSDTCSFVRATTYRCPNVCVLDGLCKGSRDDSYRSLWETNIYTTAY
jgi:hypothetical protein